LIPDDPESMIWIHDYHLLCKSTQCQNIVVLACIISIVRSISLQQMRFFRSLLGKIHFGDSEPRSRNSRRASAKLV